MAPNEELKSFATSTFDFYELLSLPTNFSQKELDRARRLTSFKYHPDKVGDDASAREKLHMTNVGYELLNDPQLRSLYDNARSARERKKASEAHLEAGRRKLKEDLEARELAGRRAAEGAQASASKLNESEQKLRWLAEDGKRRRLELQARREREHQDEESKNRHPSDISPAAKATSKALQEEDVPELDRSVKLTFPRVVNAQQPTPAFLTNWMQAYGRVDSAFLVKDKRAKTSKSKEDHKEGTAYVVFLQQAGAVAALRAWQKHKQTVQSNDQFWLLVESVSWAGGEEPEGIREADVERKPNTAEKDKPATDGGALRNPFARGSAGQASLEEQALASLREAATRQISQVT